jgi:hypothetical protein
MEYIIVYILNEGYYKREHIAVIAWASFTRHFIAEVFQSPALGAAEAEGPRRTCF